MTLRRYYTTLNFQIFTVIIVIENFCFKDLKPILVHSGWKHATILC